MKIHLKLNNGEHNKPRNLFKHKNLIKRIQNNKQFQLFEKKQTAYSNSIIRNAKKQSSPFKLINQRVHSDLIEKTKHFDSFINIFYS